MINITTKKYAILSIIFVSILGTLLHFTYNLSNQNTFVALFSAVNESTWEHLKLLFFPSLLTIIFGEKLHNGYLCAKTKGTLLGMAFIIVFFYTYTGMIGKDIPLLSILSFFIAVILSEIYTYKKINSFSKENKLICTLTLIILTVLFFIFTFNAPKIGIFISPV